MNSSAQLAAIGVLLELMRVHSIGAERRQKFRWSTRLLICLFACAIGHASAASDVRLPDGTDFVFWEQPLTFSKTYYVDGSSILSSDNGPGSAKRPFRTIGKAADVLKPGERVVIASGVYRECIRPARGGSGPDKMISYEAAPGAAVFVKARRPLRVSEDARPLENQDDSGEASAATRCQN